MNQGPIVQAVASPIADPGIVSLIPARPILSWRFIVKYFLKSFFSPPLSVSYNRKYVHEGLVNR